MVRHRQRIEWGIVGLFSCAIALISNIGYFKAVYQTPPDAVFASTTHYWEDGMFYLANIEEGRHGKWVNTYLYTEESVMPFLSHWPNILLGKISALTRLSPIVVFHVSDIILLCLFLMLSFYVMRRIFPRSSPVFFVFLFFISATSFMNKLPATAEIPYWPYDLWNTPHFIFTRFGTVPHYVTQNILFILLLIPLFTTTPARSWMKRIGIGIGMSLVTFLNPVMAAILVGTYGVTVVLWKDDVDRKTTYAIIGGFGIALLYTLLNFTVPPYTQAKLWEAAQQVRTTPLFLLKSIGPIVPFVIIGILKRLRHPKPVERFGIVLLVVGYVTFYSSLPGRLGISNVRILFPGYYFFFAWFAVIGLQTLTSWLTKVTTLNKQSLLGLLFFLYFISVTPTIVWEVKLKLLTPYATTDPKLYLPKTTFAAFEFLEQTTPYDALVVANPMSFMDIRIPALSGHKTMTGPHYATIHYEEKRKQVDAFFSLAMTQNEAARWLTSHHVSYVLFTQYDGYVGTFQKRYPFLVPVFSTPTATVFNTQ